MLEDDREGRSSTRQTLLEALHTIRTHLGMEVAFISEFDDDRRVFRFVDRGQDAPMLEVGGWGPKEESYCQRVVDGRLPEMITDASREPAALDLPGTREIPIGAHLSVPIELRDGSVFGTLCCFDRSADPSLNERDLGLMRVFADFAARQLDREQAAHKFRQEAVARIQSALENEQFFCVFQPIFNIAEACISGYEALTRFTAEPSRGPDKWFQEAEAVGLGGELEVSAMAKALGALRRIPSHCYLSINASPETVVSGQLEHGLVGYPLHQIMLEITEHDAVEDYTALSRSLAPLREGGLRLAIDDAGAGYSSFRHILSLAPDVIKLDMTLTRDLDERTDRRALATALAAFAAEIGSSLIAEGVETRSELDALREIGVSHAQGYFLAKPQPLDVLPLEG